MWDVVADMIRAKDKNKGEVERGNLPAQHTPVTPNETKSGLVGPQGGPNNIHFQQNPYYGNPPEHTKFKPGNPGGPGRHPWKRFTNELVRRIESMDPKTGELVLNKLVDSLLRKALSDKPASVSAMQTILDRYEGPITQKLELAGAILHIPIPLGDLDGDLKKLSDAELALAERVGLLALQKARQLEQQREREE
jgi:hypothetical protein